MTSSYHTYWRKLASGDRTALADRFVLQFLKPLAWIYAVLLRLRALFYRWGIFRTNRLPRPVVSIGNMTVGGTGKTPVTAYCARYLLAQGHKVVVLSRGYGGTLEGQTCIVSDGATIMMSARECGDEPYLLASTVPGLMVVIGTDRYAAGQLAMQQLLPDIFLLDDGYQHLRLYRDLNILLLDYANPYGNGNNLPAGLLREPLSAARRANLVIHTRCPQSDIEVPDVFGIPACTARHALHGTVMLTEKTFSSFSTLQNRTVLAFAGIADPGAFFEGLRDQGLQLTATLDFPDHVVYDDARISELTAAMQASKADLFITTEKDGVKLKGLPPDLAAKTLCARLNLTINDPRLLLKMLREPCRPLA